MQINPSAGQAGDSGALIQVTEEKQQARSKLASREGLAAFTQRRGSEGGGEGEDSAKIVGEEGCFNRESQEGGSVPHPGLDAASSGKVSSPGPGSPSPAQPQNDSAQRPDWPGRADQWWSWKGKIKTLIQSAERM